MEDLKDTYNPIAEAFREELRHYITQKKYVSIQYFSDIREYLSVKAVVKDLFTQASAEYILLNTGEGIRLDRIIRVEGKPAPGFEDYFACAC
ncbi:hypothetical protein HUW51_12395 [Adhaeribacter swui]|uniref:Uncharacterized protein n=1 Tax=Adhaeribacter swui TaxID=2086471 RepID=A0A7G7G8J7_9BACT|nr:hypothetical protein [Adhaeribacter swui]QNF33481.1 hypothetical protein HUW51_12395 [Adhaeribacter swui]